METLYCSHTIFVAVPQDLQTILYFSNHYHSCGGLVIEILVFLGSVCQDLELLQLHYLLHASSCVSFLVLFYILCFTVPWSI